jgi:ketosteroid isomerase-like protein
MSQENVEKVRAFVNAWNRGAWDEALKDTTPDIEFDASSNLGEWRGIHKGRGEVLRHWRRFVEHWESVRIEIHELIEAEEHVVTRQTATFLGREGIEVAVRTGWCWTFRDGRLARVLASTELDEALEAAGLRE